MFKFDNLGKYPEISHFVTDREIEEVTLRNGQEKLAKELDIETKQVVFIKQRHGSVVIEAKIGNLQEGDALVTNKTDLCLAVRVADCVPILLFDTTNKIVASIHAGWRGSVKEIVVNTLKYMQDKYMVNPGDVIAGIGPSIGPCCFEVKEHVASQFKDSYVSWFTHKMGRTIDLWRVNYDQLIKGGVQKKNIEIANICTKCNLDKYFSYRATGEASSFACGIMLL